MHVYTAFSPVILTRFLSKHIALLIVGLQMHMNAERGSRIPQRRSFDPHREGKRQVVSKESKLERSTHLRHLLKHNVHRGISLIHLQSLRLQPFLTNHAAVLIDPLQLGFQNYPLFVTPIHMLFLTAHKAFREVFSLVLSSQILSLNFLTNY